LKVILWGRLKSKERKPLKVVGFFPIMLAFSQLQDLTILTPPKNYQLVISAAYTLVIYSSKPYPCFWPQPKPFPPFSHLCPALHWAALASSLQCCSASVAAVVIPKYCTQVYSAEPPSAQDWHKWWKRGKEREEGKLGSALRRLRCSTG